MAEISYHPEAKAEHHRVGSTAGGGNDVIEGSKSVAVNLESLGLDHLSDDEKLAVAGQLWDSVLATEAPGALLSDAQLQELRRRVAEAEAHPEDYVNWSDALANTLKRLSQ